MMSFNNFFGCIKGYSKISAFTFCVVAVTNISTTLLHYDFSHSKCYRDNNRINILKYKPYIYSKFLLEKCIYNSILWPKFYWTAINSPRDAFVWNSQMDILHFDKI